MAPLPECVPLDPIFLGNLKYPRPGQLRRVLGVPEDPKARAPELRLIKETVEDVSKEARDRAKMFHQSMSKLDKYAETLSSKKRQRSDTLPAAGLKIQQSPHDMVAHRLDSKVKNGALTKRARSSMPDHQTGNRPVTPTRQQMFPDKDGNAVQVIGGISGRVEEKTRRLIVGGEGLDQKIKKKRSVGAVGNRILNGDRDMKHPEPAKLAGDSKLRLCGSHSFRLKSFGAGGINKLDCSLEPTISDSSPLPKTERESGSPARDRVAALDHNILVKGSNKPKIQQNNLVGGLQTEIRGKVSRAQRTSSATALDSSTNACPSSAFQCSEPPTLINKVEGTVNHKRQTSGGSAIHPMTQWGGQRPHKNSRTRRTNLVSPVTKVTESSHGFATFDFGTRPCFVGSTLPRKADNNDSLKVTRETDNVPTQHGLSESEESGAGYDKLLERRIDRGEASVTAPLKVGAFVSPMRKNNKISTNESGDGLKRQGKIGKGSVVPPVVAPTKEKLKRILTATESLQDVAPTSDKNKRLGKIGRPPSQKLKDRKGLPRFRTALSNGSSDFTGESDDDHEELYLAAKSARNFSSQACSSVFWKKLDRIFASVHSEDTSYLNQQISVSEEMGDCQMFGDGLQILGLDVGFSSSGGRQDAQCEKLDGKRFTKITPPLYQRVLSAFIEEDESEEFYHHSDGRNNTSLQSVSDDSHCGSSNQFDIEFKDKDRVDSEVESNQGLQTQQRNGFLERLSCDDSSPSMPGSLHSNGRWQGCSNEFLHPDVCHVGEISSNHSGCLLKPWEFDVAEFPPSDCQYHLMSVDDKVLLELHSIGLFPESLPDLADGGEMISRGIVELKNGLHKTVARKKKQLGKINKAVQKGGDFVRRNIEQVAMDKLVEMAYRKRMACRGGNVSKNAVRKVSKQVAMAFVKRALARYQKFEVTGKSCFTDPLLQDILFSVPPSYDGSKSVGYVGSGTASNTCNEASEQPSYEYGSTWNRGSKNRDALINDVAGSASSRVTSDFNSTASVVEAKGKSSDLDSFRNSSPSGGRSSLDSSGTERKTKVKSKQKITHSSTDPSRGSSHGKSDEASLPEGPDLDLGENLQFSELGSFDELGGNQDLGNLLNFEDDESTEHDLIGLEIPNDDLSDLNMLL